MKIVVKRLSDGCTFEVEVEQTDMGRVLLDKVAAKVGVPSNELKLIAQRAIIKVDKTIEQNKLYDGCSVTLVVSGKQKAIHTQEVQLPEVKTQPAQAEPTAPGSFGQGGTANQSIMSIINNAEIVQQLMQDPMIKQMINNPEFISQQLQNNPIVKNLIEKNPQIAEVLNDPSNIQTMMEMLNDPVKYDELMRHQDAAIANLQNMPGGQELIDKIQQDLIDASGGMSQQNNGWFLPNEDNNSGQQASRAPTLQLPFPVGGMGRRAETEEPLPRTYLQSIKQRGKEYTPAGLAAQPAPFGRFGMGRPGLDQLQQVLESPAIQQQIQQFVDDPVQFHQLVENPMVQQEMRRVYGPAADQLLADPEALRQQLLESMGHLNATSRQAAPQMGQRARNDAERTLANLRVKWAGQLQTIQEMGINGSEEDILQLLEIYNGNVEMVINQLLDQGA